MRLTRTCPFCPSSQRTLCQQNSVFVPKKLSPVCVQKRVSPPALRAGPRECKKIDKEGDGNIYAIKRARPRGRLEQEEPPRPLPEPEGVHDEINEDRDKPRGCINYHRTCCCQTRSIVPTLARPPCRTDLATNPSPPPDPTRRDPKQLTKMREQNQTFFPTDHLWGRSPRLHVDRTSTRTDNDSPTRRRISLRKIRRICAKTRSPISILFLQKKQQALHSADS